MHRAPLRARVATSPRSLVVRLFPAALVGTALSLTIASGSASADAPKVVVGEVSTSIGHEEVVPVMKSALSAEVAKVQPPPAGKSFVVSASLTKLDSKTSGNSVTTSCVISLALRDASGNLKGMLQGTSTVSGKHGDAAAQKESVEAAIRGAAKGLPIAIAQ